MRFSAADRLPQLAGATHPFSAATNTGWSPSTSPDAVTRQLQLASPLIRSVHPRICLVAMSSYDRGLLERLPIRVGLNESIHRPHWDALTKQVGRFRPFTLSYLLSFPNELILEVADHLDLPDLARLSRVNRHLRALLLARVFRIGTFCRPFCGVGYGGTAADRRRESGIASSQKDSLLHMAPPCRLYVQYSAGATADG